MTAEPGKRRSWIEATYWGVTTGLLGFGILGMASIGWILLVLGATLVALRPVRHRPSIFWPIAIAACASLLIYLINAPAGCTTTTFGTTAPDGKPIERTFSNCINLFGRVVR